MPQSRALGTLVAGISDDAGGRVPELEAVAAAADASKLGSDAAVEDAPAASGSASSSPSSPGQGSRPGNPHAHDGGKGDRRSGDRNASSSSIAGNGAVHSSHNPAARRDLAVYGALDLGTNNCRLLLATPTRRGFRVVDSFSRIIRLGEGLTQTGTLSAVAMQRTIEALKVCAGKIRRHRVSRARLVATEACRVATNGGEFLERVTTETGLSLEMLSRREEARLAVAGCATLIDPEADFVLVFDIGGGSTEVVWLDLTERRRRGIVPFVSQEDADDAVLAWTSLPTGVVSLAETYGAGDVSPATFEAMVAHVGAMLGVFEAKYGIARRLAGRSVHLLGTSGTVTTVAGILLGLPRYDRAKVDGCWVKVADARAVTASLVGRTHDERVAEPCIGRERADLVLAGCAILEALLRQWPAENLRVADRGLREGILTLLMNADGVYRANKRRR